MSARMYYTGITKMAVFLLLAMFAGACSNTKPPVVTKTKLVACPVPPSKYTLPDLPEKNHPRTREEMEARELKLEMMYEKCRHINSVCQESGEACKEEIKKLNQEIQEERQEKEEK